MNLHQAIQKEQEIQDTDFTTAQQVIDKIRKMKVGITTVCHQISNKIFPKEMAVCWRDYLIETWINWHVSAKIQNFRQTGGIQREQEFQGIEFARPKEVRKQIRKVKVGKTPVEQRPILRRCTRKALSPIWCWYCGTSQGSGSQQTGLCFKNMGKVTQNCPSITLLPALSEIMERTSTVRIQRQIHTPPNIGYIHH